MPRKNDDRAATKRFVDQPGQWIDTTPASVKKRQEKAWQKLQAMLKENPIDTKGTRGGSRKK